MASSYMEYNLEQFQITPRTSDDFTGFSMPNARDGNHVYSDYEMRNVHEMINLWSAQGITKKKIMDNFNRWYAVYPDMEMSGNLKSYIFITRPDMNVISGNSPAPDNQNDPRLCYLAGAHPEILWMLQSDYSSEHDFIPYLQQRAESMQLPDFQIRSSQFVVPSYNYKFAYPGVTNESTTGGSFEITFREDEYLRITKMFNFWIYYMDAVNKNILKPKKQYITSHAYDCMCSVYEIICDVTSEMVLAWAKYTGAFPTSVNTSNLSFEAHGNPDNKVQVTFDYSRIEILEPEVLSDFDYNVHKSGTNFVNIYNAAFDTTGSALAGCPKIVYTRDNKILLKWYEAKGGKITNTGSKSSALNTFALKSARAAAWKENISTNPYYKADTAMRRAFNTLPDLATDDAAKKTAELRSSFNSVQKQAVAAVKDNKVEKEEVRLSSFFDDEGTRQKRPPTDDGRRALNKDLNSQIQSVALKEDYPLTRTTLNKNHSKATQGLF